jgi:hypothetical protein
MVNLKREAKAKAKDAESKKDFRYRQIDREAERSLKKALVEQ